MTKEATVFSYDARAHSSASSATLWQLLVDAHTWPTWTTIEELVVEQSDGLSVSDGRSAVGTIQAFRTGDVVTSERIHELVPGSRFCYEDVTNDFLSDYRAVVELNPDEGGTSIRWHGTYRARPDLETVLPDYLQGVMQRYVDGLAARAEDIESARARPAGAQGADRAAAWTGRI